jgi:CheY-like chemotaxis protein
VLQDRVSTEVCRALAYVALDDPAIRARVIGILEDAGWTAIVEPTGFHLLQAIADVIDGSQTWLRPDLIVIDAFARGCAGTTIALGLRDLGITIPIVLAVAPGHPKPIASDDRMLHIVEPTAVERVVRELAHSATVAYSQPRRQRISS